jgi:putative nucleotidyltransferase with HDIG domain
MYQLNRNGGRAIGGAISFIPFLTAVMVAPNWLTPVMVGSAVAVTEARRRATPVKGVFNVAQYSLATGLATLAYLALGGASLYRDEHFHLVPYIVTLVVFLFANTMIVTGVIAASTGRSWLVLWRQQCAVMLRYDALATPLVYIFALVYNRFAFAGIIFLAILLLGGRQLYWTNRQLDQTNRDLLEVMVAAIELRDPYTSGHSQRVAEYSTVIARSIGLTRREIDRVRVAALLHDVGKIDQRFASILQKPGRLTEEERAIIELHPVISAELVGRVSGLADIVPSVRHHHERWDGAGYPDRIDGENIPLAARIITFADTIDAMTTDRPYRPALGSAEVRAELLRNRGKQFDPNLCDRLLASPVFHTLFDELRCSQQGSSVLDKETVAA